ncbi:MAG TPA: ABC transporter permease [Caldilineaceae bacterium]|nr:ABC transporter permease [Caldilineaceae bacterium]
MLAPRWRKVVRDLWSNKTRTILVLLSIAVGVTAIGMVLGAQGIVDRNLPEAYAAVHPSDGLIFCITTFDDDMIKAIEAMPEIESAEGRRFVNVRFLDQAGNWYNMQLNAIPNYEEMDINIVYGETGAFPPPHQSLLIERASLSPSLGLGGIEIGDMLTVEAPNGKQRQMRMAGTVHDMSQLPAFLNGSGYGYIDFDTLEWLGEPRDYNQVVFRVAEQRDDADHINAVAKAVQRKLERAGVTVIFALVPPPGEHPAQNFIDTLSLVLGAIGVLSLALSMFLIVNTLSAIMAQQVRQIGIMKAIGAKGMQITRMYFVMVLLFGGLSALIAVPLAGLGALGLASFFAGFLNFDLDGFHLDPQVVLIQVAIALIVPTLAALWPTFRGVRVTVREAISEYGLGKGQFGSGFLDRFFIGLRRILPIGRPMQISLRNTFRRKARLSLTLITLSLASVIFISIFSIRASLQQTLNDVLNLFDYDVQIIFDRAYRVQRIQDEVILIPGVEAVETWGFGTTRRLRPDGTESDSIIIYAPEADAETLNPTILEGRWLLPDDTNAIVINTDFLGGEEDVKLGDTVILDIENKEQPFVIVGISRGALTGANVFMNYSYFSRITNAVDRAQIALVQLTDRSAENQMTMGQLLEQRYRDSGFRVQQMQTIAQARTIISTVFDVIILFLLAMAVLLGIVGGLGLMGTMSINVIERTREIGVMRAIGATDGSVLRIVLVEGVLIGVISWLIGGLIALPASSFLTNVVGEQLLQAKPSYIFSTNGAILWLFIVMFLAGVASFLPARNASRLTVREVLSYE